MSCVYFFCKTFFYMWRVCVWFVVDIITETHTRRQALKMMMVIVMRTRRKGTGNAKWLYLERERGALRLFCLATKKEKKKPRILLLSPIFHSFSLCKAGRSE